MYSSGFKIFCLVETWLSDSIFDNETIPKGFSVYRKDRHSRGGGVLVAVSDSITSASVVSPAGIEVITVYSSGAGDYSMCSLYPSQFSCSIFPVLVSIFIFPISN